LGAAIADMKFSVLINNHNYGAYVREAVDSVLRQTFPADEIIVVDDGSTDNSLSILQEAYGKCPQVKIISQPNQGQMTAVDTGIKQATGDIICLLDADDSYQSEYLAQLSSLYHDRPEIDCVFCRFEPIGRNCPNAIPSWLNLEDYDFGYTALCDRFAKYPLWLGNVTSTISLKYSLAKNLALGELAKLFRFSICADHAIMRAASRLGGRKYYYAKNLVNYRLHEKNNWQSNIASSQLVYVHNMLATIAHDFYNKLVPLGDYNFELLKMEMDLVPKMAPEHRELYQDIIDRNPRLENSFLEIANRLERQQMALDQLSNHFFMQLWRQLVRSLFYEKQEDGSGVKRKLKLFGLGVYSKRKTPDRVAIRVLGLKFIRYAENI
jgi:glycosyltransferase involved in cell wall biosynthesis